MTDGLKAHAGGISTREWLAGMALQGILANPDTELWESVERGEAAGREVMACIVTLACELADRQLRELARP